MNDTPRTEAAKFSGIHAHTSEHYVDADFARELEGELAVAKAENARLRRCVQHLIDNGYTAGTDGQTPDELCDDLLPEEWPSCLPLPKIAHTSRSE